MTKIAMSRAAFEEGYLKGNIPSLENLVELGRDNLEALLQIMHQDERRLKRTLRDCVAIDQSCTRIRTKELTSYLIEHLCTERRCDEVVASSVQEYWCTLGHTRCWLGETISEWCRMRHYAEGKLCVMSELDDRKIRSLWNFVQHKQQIINSQIYHIRVYINLIYAAQAKAVSKPVMDCWRGDDFFADGENVLFSGKDCLQAGIVSLAPDLRSRNYQRSRSRARIRIKCRDGLIARDVADITVMKMDDYDYLRKDPGYRSIWTEFSVPLAPSVLAEK